MFFFCAPEPKVKSAERAFEEACVEKNALRAYAATYSKLEDVQKDDSPWKPVFEGHLLKSVYANTAELKVLIENTADMQWISISGTDAPETVLVDSELESKNDFGVAMHKGVLRVASDVHDALWVNHVTERGDRTVMRHRAHERPPRRPRGSPRPPLSDRLLWCRYVRARVRAHR